MAAAAFHEAARSMRAVVSDKAEVNIHGRKSGEVLRPMEIMCGVFWPCLLFAYTFRLNLTIWRHHHAMRILVLSTLIPILVNAFFSYKYYTILRSGAYLRRWKVIVNIVCWAIIFFAFVQADKAYWRFAKSYYDYQSVAMYINIDPSKDRGQAYMDAGQVYFKEGTQVEITKAIAFQEDEIYCAAPIVQQTLDSQGDDSEQEKVTDNALKLPKSGTVDFWAVGINCCDPSGQNFKCGDSRNPLARAGIRELRDDSRPFFLMAVQEWTAQLKMPAKHPLFFHWVQDPLLQVDNFWWDAMKSFYFNLLQAFMGVLGGTIILHLILFNLGI